MNTDIRISVSAISHPKIIKLMRKCGDIAFFNLIRLWTFTAQNKPSGDLDNMDDDDIEIAADWHGESGAFVAALLELRLLEQADGGCYVVHDWAEHNGYASYAEQRSERARNAANKRWKTQFNADEHMLTDAKSNATSINEHMLNDASSNAPSPSPSPAPLALEDTSLRSVSSCPELPAGASGPQQVEPKPKPEIIDQPSPAILAFPLAKKGETFPVTQSDIDEWQESFPGVDVLMELRHCLQWSRDNPARRKTRAGIRRHITGWLAKQQDRARGQPHIPPAGQRQMPDGYPVPRTVRDAITIQQDMEAKRLLAKKLRERGVKDESGNGDSGNGAGRADHAQPQIGAGPVQ